MKKKISKVTGTSPYFAMITLNVNDLNSPTKRGRWAEWIQKRKKQQTNQPNK
jgi:hypothetical protein